MQGGFLITIKRTRRAEVPKLLITNKKKGSKLFSERNIVIYERVNNREKSLTIKKKNLKNTPEIVLNTKSDQLSLL